MTDLQLSFDTATMLRLTGEQCKELATTGETTTGFAPARRAAVNESFSRLVLSLNGSISNYFFEFEPQQDIDTFINNAWLTHYFPKTGKVSLIKGFEQPLGRLLPERRGEITEVPVLEKTTFINKQGLFNDQLIEQAAKTLIISGNFKGQLSRCECGESGCSSEYLWAMDNLGLVSFHIFSAGLQRVNLYPFQLL